MDFYFAPLACSMATRIVVAEAGGTINWIEIDPSNKKVLATGEDYLAINPLGMVPALRTDDGEVLTENAAILQYVADCFPAAGLAPPVSDATGRARLRQWLSFIGAELHKGLMIPLLDRKAPEEVKAWALRKYVSRLAYLNEHLSKGDFLLDRFTVADAYLATVLNWTQATPQIDLSEYPALKAYLDRMRARPSVAAALGVEIPLFRAEIARRKAA
jgi:glutathione S-transferase